MTNSEKDGLSLPDVSGVPKVIRLGMTKSPDENFTFLSLFPFHSFLYFSLFFLPIFLVFPVPFGYIGGRNGDGGWHSWHNMPPKNFVSIDVLDINGNITI
ncbi:hypothetical protein KAU32_07525 [bacterium]|nr:hypothetical protein [bacterium]